MTCHCRNGRTCRPAPRHSACMCAPMRTWRCWPTSMPKPHGPPSARSARTSRDTNSATPATGASTTASAPPPASASTSGRVAGRRRRQSSRRRSERDRSRGAGFGAVLRAPCRADRALGDPAVPLVRCHRTRAADVAPPWPPRRRADLPRTPVVLQRQRRAARRAARPRRRRQLRSAGGRSVRLPVCQQVGGGSRSG